MKHKKNTVIAFFILLLITFFLFVQLYNNKKESDNISEWVLQSLNSKDQTEALSTSLFNLESGVRGYVITGNKIFLKYYDRDKAGLLDQLSGIESFYNNNSKQKENLYRLKKLVLSKVNFQDKILEAYGRSSDEALQIIGGLQGKVFTDSIMFIKGALQNEEKNNYKQKMDKSNQLIEKRYATITIAGIMCFLLLSFALRKMYKEAMWREAAKKAAQINLVKYKNLVENSSIITYTTNEKGHFVFISANSLEFTGYKKEELAGSHFSVLIPDDWKAYVVNFYVKQMKSQITETSLRIPLQTKNGYIKWVEQITILLLNDNKITGFQSLVKDVTETKLSEDLIRDAEEKMLAIREENRIRLQAILDNIPMSVYIKDVEGKFILVNKQFKETYNLTEEDVIGNTVTKVEGDILKAQKYILSDNKVIETKQPYEFEEIIETNEGETNLLITKFPLFDKNNNLFGVCGIDKDITEIGRSRQKLLAAKVKAEKAEQLQEEFLANMSHEIRTPMNGVIGMANLLLGTGLNQTQQEYVEIIKQSSDILLGLINDILDLSKIKAGRMEIETIDFNVKDAIEKVCSPIRYKLSNDVSCNIVVDENIPPLISGDMHKLIQVLNNLVSNAAKFTKNGEIKIAVHIAESVDDKINFEFVVSDTGIGIPEEHLHNIFNNFAQGNINTVRKYGGTGLGLAIVKRLVELQGGSINVTSKVNKGTTFSFQIPYNISDADHRDVDTYEDYELNDEFKLAGKKILLVEDNKVNQKVVIRTLNNYNVQCTVANNGKEAVAILEKQQDFDLIIMDLQMPEMNGFETTSYIRQKLHIDIPIMAMTASALRNEKVRCMEVGMNGYLTKPFAPENLIYNLNSLILNKNGDGAEPISNTVSAGYYNLDYLKQLGGKEIQRELFQIFLDTSPLLIANLKSMLLQEDWEGVYKNAHELKSTIGIFQINGILENANELEISVKQKNYDAIESLVIKIDQEYKLVKKMIEAELAEIS